MRIRLEKCNRVVLLLVSNPSIGRLAYVDYTLYRADSAEDSPEKRHETMKARAQLLGVATVFFGSRSKSFKFFHQSREKFYASSSMLCYGTLAVVVHRQQRSRSISLPRDISACR